MKKLLYYCSIFSLIFGMTFMIEKQASNAMESPGITENQEDEEVVSEETLELINELYSERRALALDYEENQSKIEQLDKKIEQLGVVTLSDEEVEEKSKILLKTDDGTGNSQRVTVSSAKDTQWTSVRQNTMYNGKEYQLQIIRGIAKNANSTLVGEDYSDSKYSYGFVAGSKNVLKLVISNGISAAGDIAAAGVTFYDVFSEFVSGMKPTSNIEGAKCTYNTSFSVEVVYIFVKYKGALDEDQVICYMGNIVTAETLVATASGITVDGKYIPKVKSETYAYKVKSEGYDLSSSYACEAFYNYNRHYNYHYLYNMGRFTLEPIGVKDVSIIIPKIDLNGN